MGYVPHLPIPFTRSKLCLRPDPRRVISRAFLPGGVFEDGRHRVQRIVERVLQLPEADVALALAETRQRFASRHVDLEGVLERHFGLVAHHVQSGELSRERQLLIGAYFTHEYSVDAAALSNPSLVRAPHQEGVAPGSLRFVMSLRAIGEGHLSSIQFRSGVVDADGQISLDETSPFARTANHRPPVYEKSMFCQKLLELDAYTETAQRVLQPLGERFSAEELAASSSQVEQQSAHDQGASQAVRTLHWLASSNYESTFHAESQVSERVIFPASPTESHGMELSLIHI